jgi:phosphoglycerate dehydrogenase-like enzyme
MTDKITILDDYQGVALAMADWSGLAERYEIDVVREHLDDPDQLIARLEDSRVVVAMRERTPFPRAVLDRLPGLELLVTTGMGNAAIDLAAARDRGLPVSGTQGSSSSVPELVFGVIIALARHIPAENAAMHEGGWQHTLGRGLAGSTIGILGLGRLGSSVARIAPAFAMRVVAWSPHLTQEGADAVGARSVGKRELFSGSDFLTIHVPLNEGTRDLVGAEELGWMPPRSYLVNTSRGPIVNEAALVAALASNAIAGAALDVYDREPLPTGHALRGLQNALLLPHLGYVTEQTYEVFFGQVVEDIVAFDAGNPIRLLG